MLSDLSLHNDLPIECISHKVEFVKTTLMNCDLNSTIGIRIISTFNIDHKNIRNIPIIIHIHGGGFIAGSTQNCLIYTRKFSKYTNIPIFSLEYRLAPKYQYPSAIDDVFQGYMWVLENSEKLYGIRPTKIIFIGDSAGANLCISLCFLCIKKKLRKPDGVLLGYPRNFY